MSGPQVIEFITITSGGVTMNARANTSAALIAEMRRVIKPSPMITVPGNFGCKLTAGPGTWVFTLFRDHLPITTCFVCWDAAHSEQAWEMAQHDAPDNVVLRRPRGVPWLSARIEPSMMLATLPLDELAGLAQTELAIAWAIIDRETGSG